jgi:hypothetical protein
MIKCKARLVIRGFKHKREYEKFETYAPVVKISLVRMVLIIANMLNLSLFQFDVKTAFLNGKLDEQIYMSIPVGFIREFCN